MSAPESRNEAILQAMIDGTEYTAPPQSRIEALLLELKTAIENSSPLNIEQVEFSSANVKWATSAGGGICSIVKLVDLPDYNGKKRFLGSFYLSANGATATIPPNHHFYEDLKYNISSAATDGAFTAPIGILALVTLSDGTTTGAKGQLDNGRLTITRQIVDASGIVFSLPLCMFTER